MKLFIWLSMLFLATGLNKTSQAAFHPTHNQLTATQLSTAISVSVSKIPTSPQGSVKPSRVKGRYGLKAKLMTVVLKSRILKQLAGIDQPTEKQMKLGRLSLIFAGAALVLLVMPYAALALPAVIGVLSLPAAIAGLVLGIKSIRGNSNVPGLVGLILSASILLVMILAIIFLALFFNGSWI